MRPMLTLACARVLDYPGQRHHKLAAAVEFIHTATLLHDDVVDGSDMRRGKTAANLIFGNPAAVLVGDFLFSRSFELMVEDGSLKVLKILSHASAVIAEGEVNQLTAQRQISTGEEKYLEIIGAKTAALFAAACRIAAVVAESGEAQEMALDAYGRNLGIAFQLVDDAIDYVSDGATMGKDSGDDFRDGKVTLPVILAHCRGTTEEQKFWRDAMLGNRVSTDDLAYATALLRKHGAIDDTIDRARHYGQRAVDAIAHFPAVKPRLHDRGRGIRNRPRLLTMEDRPSLSDGFDRIGPFHPYVVMAAVALLDILAILLVLTALTVVGDKIEDVIWPGGREWVDL